MITDSAPGVFYETVDAGAPPVTLLRTDITGFVGIADRGPIDVPVPIQSWRQFGSWFGDYTGAGFLAYAVRAFFENGGRRCWVVRVAAKDEAAGAACASIDVASSSGPVWRVRASSEGTWGNHLAFTLRERNPAQVVTDTNDPDGAFSVVANVDGFQRGTHVRCSDPRTGTTVWKVVADVDPHRGRIWWVDPEKERRLARYDGPLAGVDLGGPVVIRSVEYAITVSYAGRLLRFYDNLSMIPEADRYAPRRLAALAPTIDPTTGMFVARAPEPIVIEDLRTDLTDIHGPDVDPAQVLPAVGGRDGLATLTVDDFVGAPIAPDDGSEAVATKRRGLRALESIPEIGLLAIPDAQVRPVARNPVALPPPCEPDPCIENPPPLPPPVLREPGELPPTFGSDELFRIQSEMVSQCERLRDRFALLDPPYDASTSALAGIRGIGAWRARFDTKYAALYFPWIKVVDPLSGTRLVPPSGHVAGAVAGTDLEIGVHKAPANRRIEWAVDASVTVSEAAHALLNTSGVNALRTTGGRGLRILGARTLSSDPDWRFVNVRRLVSMIEKALETALQWAVFEPNDVFTRARATLSATVFLLDLHERGMLAGATPEESFEIKCDLDNNPDAERDLGRLIIEIGVAPSKPFEFVVLRVGRVRDALEVVE